MSAFLTHDPSVLHAPDGFGEGLGEGVGEGEGLGVGLGDGEGLGDGLGEGVDPAGTSWLLTQENIAGL